MNNMRKMRKSGIKVNIRRAEKGGRVSEADSTPETNKMRYGLQNWFKGLGGVIGVFTILPVLWTVSMDLYNEYQESHPKYAYEQNTDWLRMDEAAVILSNQSSVEVYKYNSEENIYYNGAALTVLYHNLDEQERIITRFSVYAEDIVEDYSPLLYYHTTYSMNPIGYRIFNSGWGESGKIDISLLDIAPISGMEAQQVVELSLREDAVTSWELDSIKPGEQRECYLLSEQDIVVEYKEGYDNQIVYYNLRFELNATETNYEDIIDCIIEVHPDKLQIFTGGQGGNEPKYYVVMVDTAEPTWSDTFDVFQRLPGMQTVRLPIFIVPKMSCTMSVRIKFETMDGEVIEAEPLQNVKFVIPYYEDASTYIDGKLIDWDSVDGERVVYFPFETNSKVIP